MMSCCVCWLLTPHVAKMLKFVFQSYHKGKLLLDFVFNRLNLVETDYFALRYVDQNKQRVSNCYFLIDNVCMSHK